MISKAAWIILLISAGTDLLINTGSALGAAMVATGNASVPSKAVIILAIITGVVAAARTIQQALKSEIKNTNDSSLMGAK